MTTTTSEIQVQITTTSALLAIFASMISSAVSGSTSRWSRVPCSRSRSNAVPVRMIARMVMLFTIWITARNQPPSRLGLNKALGLISTGLCAVVRCV
ncbi:hypothetical protein D3C71_1747500 [compost metagenome]